jgi:beta-glucosidase
MIITDVLSTSTAVVSAWLPGTAGGDGIVSALTGGYTFRPNGASDRRNTLAFDWPKTQASLKAFPVYGSDGEVPRIADPLFTVGYGLGSGVR